MAADLLQAVQAVGRKTAVSAVARSSPSSQQPELGVDAQLDTDTEKTTSAVAVTRQTLEEWLDATADFSGSFAVFMLTFGAVLTWALLGIEFGSTVSWAVTISNVQAVVCYVLDSLLMRQQLTGYDNDMRNAAVLQSRQISHKRMVHEVLQRQERLTIPSNMEVTEAHARVMAATKPSDSTQSLAARLQHWQGRISDVIAATMGHIAFSALFWVCIAVWLGFGPYCQWSNEWQLYINSSTSALLLLVFSVLSNIRTRHAALMRDRYSSITRVDEELESTLRGITSDLQPNLKVSVPVPPVSRGQRAIFYYSDLVGTLTGVVLMLLAIIAWLATGPVLEFSDNWWLLIGTYAGLIGMHDGFVLENMQTCLAGYVNGALATVRFADVSLLQDVGLATDRSWRVGSEPIGLESQQTIHSNTSLVQRISQTIINATSRPVAVLLNVLVILGLLVGASVMQWSLTGQLLCNVPPSIIESFMMLVVITGHDLAEQKRSADIEDILNSRVLMLCWARAVVPVPKY